MSTNDQLSPLPKGKGLWNELFEFYNEQSPVYRPYLAHASVISTVAPLVSNLYTLSNCNMAAYLLILCRSGGGKNQYLKASSKLFSELELDYVGLGSYRSDSAIIETLPEQPVRQDCIDEISSIFITASKASSGCQANIPTILTEMWSVTGKYPGMRTKGDGTYGACENPSISLIGALTPSAYHDCYNPKLLRNGFLSRFLHMYDNSPGELKELDYSKSYEIPESIRDQVLTLHNLKQARNNQPVNLPVSKEAKAELTRINKLYFDYVNSMPDEHLTLPILSRAFEYILRLTVYYTVSKDVNITLPKVTKGDVLWAENFYRTLHSNSEISLFSKLDESSLNKDCTKIKNIVLRENNCIDRSLLLRNSNFTARHLDLVLNQLKELNEITVFKDEKTTFYQINS